MNISPYVRLRNLGEVQTLPEFIPEHELLESLKDGALGRSSIDSKSEIELNEILYELSYMASAIAYQLGFDHEFATNITIDFKDYLDSKEAFLRVTKYPDEVLFSVSLPIYDIFDITTNGAAFARTARFMAHELYHIYTYMTNEHAAEKAVKAALQDKEAYRKNWAEIAAELYAIKFMNEYASSNWNENEDRCIALRKHADYIAQTVRGRLA